MNQMCIFLNSTWRTAAILEIVFGHNSAVDFPISVKFCTGMQNSTLSAWTSSFLRQHGLATGRRILVQKKNILHGGQVHGRADAGGTK